MASGSISENPESLKPALVWNNLLAGSADWTGWDGSGWVRFAGDAARFSAWVCCPSAGFGRPGFSPSRDAVWGHSWHPQRLSSSAEVWRGLSQLIFLVRMGTGNVGSLKLLISFPGMVFPSPFFLYFWSDIFWITWRRFSLFFFQCGCTFAFIGSVRQEEKGTRQKVVLEMIANDREAALGWRGDTDRCRRGWGGSGQGCLPFVSHVYQSALCGGLRVALHPLPTQLHPIIKEPMGTRKLIVLPRNFCPLAVEPTC